MKKQTQDTYPIRPNSPGDSQSQDSSPMDSNPPFPVRPIKHTLLFLLQWMDCSCTCLLPRYLNLFHILVYNVGSKSPNVDSVVSFLQIKSLRAYLIELERLDHLLLQQGYTRTGDQRFPHMEERPPLWTSMEKKKTQIAAVILPSLRRLHVDLVESNYAEDENPDTEIIGKKRPEGGDRFSNGDLEREDECGICLEPCTKMVLPNCCHAMCINCYRDWNMRSESCPFCRGSIKRVKSRDLWVLTCSDDVVDTKTVSTEDFLCFYHCISSLPKDFPEAFFLMQYEYLL